MRRRGVGITSGVALLLVAGLAVGIWEASRQPHIELRGIGVGCLSPGTRNLTYDMMLLNNGTANGYATVGFYEATQFGRALKATQRYFVPVGETLSQAYNVTTEDCFSALHFDSRADVLSVAKA